MRHEGHFIRKQAGRGKRRQATCLHRGGAQPNRPAHVLVAPRPAPRPPHLARHRVYRGPWEDGIDGACQGMSCRCAVGEEARTALENGRAAPRSPTRKKTPQPPRQPHAPTHKHKAPAALGTNEAAIIFSVTFLKHAGPEARDTADGVSAMNSRVAFGKADVDDLISCNGKRGEKRDDLAVFLFVFPFRRLLLVLTCFFHIDIFFLHYCQVCSSPLSRAPSLSPPLANPSLMSLSSIVVADKARNQHSKSAAASTCQRLPF